MWAQFLVSPITPWVMATVVLLSALTIWMLGRRSHLLAVRMGCVVTALVIVMIGGAMFAGSAAMALRGRELTAMRPPSGKLVDIGGYNSFIQCEGPRTPSVLLWLSGGYLGSRHMVELHDRVKRVQRSCLIDRPGTGWAGVGPLPRRTEMILREIRDTLEAAQETGPLVIAGHSMGGLYAANYAEAYPERVKGIVLLDPTPPAWYIEQIHLMGCGPETPPGADIYLAMFGVPLIRQFNPLFKPYAGYELKALYGKNLALIADQELRPHSIVSAWTAGRDACVHGLSLVRSPGALSDLPVLMIVQDQRDRANDEERPAGLSDREARNRQRLRVEWTDAYVGYTSRGQLEYAPKGAGHLFPMSHPDFTVAKVQDFVSELGLAPPVASANPEYGN